MSESAQLKTGGKEDLEKLSKMINGISFAMLTTQDSEGKMHSRPMVTRDMECEDGSLWFLTRESTGKVRQIHETQIVNVAFSDPKNQSYVSISGRAECTKDKEKIKQLWNPMYKAWFPQGMDDPEVTAIRVVVDEAEYWDSPSSTVAHLYGYAKAMITGTPAHPGDHAKVAVST